MSVNPFDPAPDRELGALLRDALDHDTDPGFAARLPDRDPLIDEEETEDGSRELAYDSMAPRPRLHRRGSPPESLQ